MSNNLPVIELEHVQTHFGTTCVHEDASLRVHSGEIIGIVGGSGSGKTTLLRAILMLLQPTGGRIRLFGRDTQDLLLKEILLLRQRMGVMFQTGALFSSLTVEENVTFPLTLHTKLPYRLRSELARLKIALAGLPLSAADKYPSELSGGMVKRAAVARAIALDPKLLFLDEPTAGLDPNGASALDDMILNLRAALGLTITLVSHDLDTLWRVTDRVAFLGEKRILAVAPMEQLYQSDHPLIQEYFSGKRAKRAAHSEE